MNKQKISIILSAVFLCLMIVNHSSCQSNSKKIQTLKADEYQAKMEKLTNKQVIDVRTPDEYKDGHLKNAYNVDWNAAGFDEGMKSLDKTKPTFVYCLAGGRSAAAAAKLEQLGFLEIYNLEGGITAWKKANKPLEKMMEVSESHDGMGVKEYEKLVSESKLTLVDFNAPWCGPCRKMKPILDQISTEKAGKIKIIPINADDNEIMSANLQIEALPTFILYKNGKQVERFMGYMEKEDLMEILSKYF